MSFLGLPFPLKELLARHLCPLQPSSFRLISHLSPLPSLPARILPFLPFPCPQLGYAHSCLRIWLTGWTSFPSPAYHWRISLKNRLKFHILLKGAHFHVLYRFLYTVFLKEREGALWLNKFRKPRVIPSFVESLTGQYDSVALTTKTNLIMECLFYSIMVNSRLWKSDFLMLCVWMLTSLPTSFHFFKMSIIMTYVTKSYEHWLS